MTQIAQDILEKYNALCDSDRAELSEIIADKMTVRSDMEYLTAWSEEIRSRIDEHENGDEAGVPWEQLRAQLMEEDELAG